MEPGQTPGREIGSGYHYVSMGLTFAGGTILFMGLGYLVDRWLGFLPFLTIAGTIVGSVLSFVWVYRKLQQEERAYEVEHPRKRRGPAR
jgi:F0F1-type ATP synthase assembly protein I